VGDLKQQMEKRFNLNVVGSRKVMNLALRYGAKRLVVLSTFHIYGAHPHNHIPIAEDEPLRAGENFPQIADAIELDNHAVIWAYQHPEMKTAVLRPTNVIGPDINNAMSKFLRMPRLPVMMGFDPMTQFVHQDDLADAIVRMTEDDAVGVFNVTGPRALPWRKALDAIDARTLPVPTTVAFTYLRLAGLVTSTFPPYLVNFFKYPCIIADGKIRRALAWTPQVEPEEALRDTVRNSSG
jgi:UDP-glucose 4-epimerase